uniref:Uncharacterized protein n=1 Tax=Romanomermis culicivorax TaxID=13658 RepID=A0A915JMX4_ROMCU
MNRFEPSLQKNIVGFVANIRGISHRFGEDIVSQFCAKNKLSLIARAHQVVNEGYEFFADFKLITLFSAPNYCGQFLNNGAALRITETMKWSLIEGGAADIVRVAGAAADVDGVVAASGVYWPASGTRQSAAFQLPPLDTFSILKFEMF